MIDSISISNFRLFRHVEASHLGRVNLIVGKNNSGKSAFLEALQLFASNASPSVILELVESRQEAWASEGQLYPPKSSESSVRHLFFEHRLPDLDGEGIRIGETNSESQLHVTTAAFKTEQLPDGTIDRTRITNIGPEEELADIALTLIAEDSQRTRRILSLEDDIRRRRSPSRYERLAAEAHMPCQVVPTENMSNRKIAALWDLTSLTKEESEVVAALQLIEPRVSGVAFVEDVNSRGRSGDNRIPLVKIEGYREPLPLKSMGDGMTRIFHIIVALVNAREGILLVDEFENGLHWSVQPLIWSIVFRIASLLNVQVFATTHSRDCVAGFDKAWNEHERLGAFFRLEALEGSVSVTQYTSETLSDSIDMNVEIR